jgi:hypothetical protein
MERRVTRLRTVLAFPEEKRLAWERLDFLLCKQNIEYWIDNYAQIIEPRADDPAQREMPLVLWDSQRTLISWLAERAAAKESALIPKGRSLGVSWICLILCYYRWRFENLFTAKIGSRDERLVDDTSLDSIFGKLRHLHSMQPAHLREGGMTTKKLHLVNTRNGSELIGETTNASFGRGRRSSVVVLDEFAHVEPRLQESIWVGMESVSSSVWVPSTPKGKNNKFASLMESLPARKIHEMTWRDCPYRPANFRELSILPLGDLTAAEFDQEHEAKAMMARTGRIWTINKERSVYNDSELERVTYFKHARAAMPAYGGWDFGSGASYLVCLFALLDLGPEGKNQQVIIVDDERIWGRTAWRSAAADVRGAMKQYGWHKPHHFGDPAGKAAESDQMSWEKNLRSGGIPLQCLPGAANTPSEMDWTMRMIQTLLDDERLIINRRCTYLLSCIESWRYDVPDGVEPEMVNKLRVPPRKDQWSHGANALMYLVYGIMKAMNQLRRLPETHDLPQSETAPLEEIWSTLR